MDTVKTERPAWILPAIVAGQLLATSLWFATNAVIGSLQGLWGIAGGQGIVTTAVQIGFISGTLAFAIAGLLFVTAFEVAQAAVGRLLAEGSAPRVTHS